MIKKIMWGISLLSLVGTAFVIQYLPESVPMHADLEGNIDRWGSKYEQLIFPVMILLITLFWSLMIRYFEKKAKEAEDEKEKAGAKSNAMVMGIVGLGNAAMFTIMHGALLYSAYITASTGGEQMSPDVGKISCFFMGVLFLVLGNYMTKTRINSMVGFRIVWSMYNDETWRRSNRFGAILLMADGVVAMRLACLLKSSFAAVMIVLVLGVLICIVTMIYSYRVYTEVKAKENAS